MHTIIKLSLSAILLFCSNTTIALPDAVCGNGEHVGNPHCTSNSSAPVKHIGSASIGIGILFAAGVVGLLFQRNKQYKNIKPSSEK